MGQGFYLISQHAHVLVKFWTAARRCSEKTGTKERDRKQDMTVDEDGGWEEGSKERRDKARQRFCICHDDTSAYCIAKRIFLFWLLFTGRAKKGAECVTLQVYMNHECVR